MAEITQIDLPLKNLVRQAEKGTDENPTIFFLHGFGSNMQDLFGLTQFFGKEWNCISLEASIPTHYNGWAWAELDPVNVRELPRPEQFRIHYEKIIESIEKSVDLLDLEPKRIALLGFSQGASMSIYCGLKNPNMFRSIVALCGYLPVDKVRSEVDLTLVKELDLFMGNGRLDMVVPLSLAQSSRDGLLSIGVNPSYKEYDSAHTIPNDCLNDVLEWLHRTIDH